MKKIQLTQGKEALVDDQDYEWLNQWKWCCSANDYAVRRLPKTEHGQKIWMHRLILDAPPDKQVDHIKYFGEFARTNTYGYGNQITQDNVERS